MNRLLQLRIPLKTSPKFIESLLVTRPYLSTRTVATMSSPSSVSSINVKKLDSSGTNSLNLHLTLPDNRILSYADIGPRSGFPLLFFHGYPSSRLEIDSLGQRLATRHNLRLICIDRPGFGLSTFQPHRQIIDWPEDVRHVLRHAGIKRFAVLGGSGGGPYALACARAWPSAEFKTKMDVEKRDANAGINKTGEQEEELVAVGILAGAPPWTAGTKDLMKSARVFAWLAKTIPKPLEVLLNYVVRFTKWISSTEKGQKTIDKWLDGLNKKLDKEQEERALLLADNTPPKPKPEPEAATIEEQRERALRIIFEAFRQGTKATVQETVLLTEDWGFRFEDVPYEGIKLWHGTLDINAPVSMIRYMAERLPKSVLREYEGENHFAAAYHLDDVFEDLIPAEHRPAKEESRKG